jgi:hypothetical protein
VRRELIDGGREKIVSTDKGQGTREKRDKG